MKKALTIMSVSGLALTGMFGLSLALPSSDASAATWSQIYKTKSQCNIARNAALGSGYRGPVSKCEPRGTQVGGYLMGYSYKVGY